mmetsp:Transcript_21664/g.71676  ORF Transcript_21664/g.71676 Transcript_21664/m.71676 type:complete len:179 (-) Transcript_21664:48-584(-)
MLSYLAAKGITVSQPSIAGIGLVLDIRSRSAQNAVNKLQRKLEFLVESGETAGQEMQEIGASNDPDVDNLRKQLGQAMVELEASREDDAIVVEDVIEDGPAHRSNKFSVGDRVLQVDGTPVGVNLDLCGNLIRGEEGASVKVSIKKAESSVIEDIVIVRGTVSAVSAQQSRKGGLFSW